MPLRTAHLGLGPIGLAALKSVAGRDGTRVAAAVDIRDDLQGRDAGELAGLTALGVAVARSLDEAGPRGSADVVVHCTGSRLVREMDRILAAIDWGASVVSTCEELAYPWRHHPEEARRIDDAARSAGVAVFATGVNPGFAMDAMALALSAAAERVDRIHVHRVVDAATRRGPLQQKVGAGIDTSEFDARRAAGTIGHVGLVESVALVADGLGWPVDDITETLDPVIAEAPVRTDVVDVPAGRVAGIRQVAIGLRGDRERIRLHLEMYVGAADPGDRVSLEGDPSLVASINGLHGDLATAAIVANAVAAVRRFPPGLVTMLDLLPLRRG